VQLFQGKERVQVADWRHGETLYLAILIDDSLDSEAASQWSDLKSFINSQPEGTQIAVAYARQRRRHDRAGLHPGSIAGGKSVAHSHRWFGRVLQSVPFAARLD